MNIFTFTLFFTLFLAFYLGLNLYVYLFIIKNTPIILSAIVSKSLYFVILFLSIAYPLGHMLDRVYPGIISYILTLFGAIWFGYVSISVPIFVLSNILVLILNLFRNLKPYIPTLKLVIYSFSVFLAIFLCIYASFQAYSSPKLIHINLKTPNLKTEQLTLVHLSDVHIGILSRKSEIIRLINICKKNNPDLIVITGDLTDSSLKTTTKFIPLFKELSNICPVYGTTGNHEFYVGIDKIEHFYKDTNMTLLRNELTTFKGIIDIISYDDDEYTSFTKEPRLSLFDIFSKSKKDKPIIYLTHRPTNFRKVSKLGAFLQLSGHTHDGQIFPWNLVVRLIFKYPKGLHKYKESYIYTHSGSSTWGPPMRLGTNSEMVIIKLRR